MRIQYKCKCMKAERFVKVPDRVPDSDLEPWMQIMTACVTYDHHARFAFCRTQSMEYVRIPHSDPDQPLGQPLVKN